MNDASVGEPANAGPREPEESPTHAGPASFHAGGQALPWVMFVLALALAFTFGWMWHQARGDTEAARAATAQQAQVKDVATKFLLALTNFKSDTIDADVARIKSFAVGDFADQASQVFGPNFFDQVKKARVVSTGVVKTVFVQSISGPNAEVFAVVDETFQNASQGSQTEVIRFDVKLIDTKDGWKISSVELLQSPAASPFGA